MSFPPEFTVREQTLVYPAHDYKGWTVSTIGEERAHNPRLQVRSKQDYIERMQASALRIGSRGSLSGLAALTEP